MTASSTSEGFCVYCTNFSVRMVGSKPTCTECAALWSSRSYYWTALDDWEVENGKKIDDVKAERERDKTSYVSGGGLEKDLAVLTAQVKLDTAYELAHKVLEIMEAKGKENPRQAMNEVATQLGFYVGDATRDLGRAKTEKEESEA